MWDKNLIGGGIYRLLGIPRTPIRGNRSYACFIFHVDVTANGETIQLRSVKEIRKLLIVS